MNSPADDRRSVPELFEVALCSGDEDVRWDAVAALHWRGSRGIFDRAAKLCRSKDAEERALGADILGQLGIPERTFPDESFDTIATLLSDTSEEVLFSAILALQHVNLKRAASHVLAFCDHPNDNVRYAVAVALGGVDDETAIKALVRLASDGDAEVRNWATFGLAQQCDVDTSEIREVLVARLEDQDQDVRYEAIYGLARRRDAKAVGYLKTILHDDPDDVFAREAAALLVGMEHSGDTSTSDLLGALQRHQRWSLRRA
ncbi:HEAT repeat domain-containing protein [Altericroceibacterium xinjiangense]|uniref:HEAT repeat domain-containing protein n=1 Tax=Altericroceibacterium xinjiangense TaxID=762261 RepID=UPI000F7E4AAF|nr:HEAT repeat domain-containing protein [Altericroceibacterium xinjiangense]